VLLSLHAEQIASKWATGPVIQTPAFRQLVGATPYDRIVALVMIGMPRAVGLVEEEVELAAIAPTNSTVSSNCDKGGGPHPRRFRRNWETLLQDL
jgi:hypothetical protein